MKPEEIKKFRKKLGFSVKSFADECNLSPKYGHDYIRKLERGSQEPSGVLTKLWELMQIKLDLLKKNLELYKKNIELEAENKRLRKEINQNDTAKNNNENNS